MSTDIYRRISRALGTGCIIETQGKISRL